MMILGRFPPRYIAVLDEPLGNVVRGLNFRGVRYAPTIDKNGKYAGLVRLLDVIGSFSRFLKKGDIEGFVVSPVGSIVTNIPSLYLEDVNLEEILSLMREHDVGGLAITNESGEVVGEVTENNLIDLLSHSKKYGVPVKAVMTPSPVSISADDTLETALDLMLKERARRLPVVYQDELVGILTINDVIKFLSSRIPEGIKADVLSTPAWYVSTPKPITIHENEDCSEAVSLIRSEGVGGLLVVNDDGYLTGIVSERDLLFRLPYVTELSIRTYLFEPYKHYLGI